MGALPRLQGTASLNMPSAAAAAVRQRLSFDSWLPAAGVAAHVRPTAPPGWRPAQPLLLRFTALRWACCPS